MSAGVGCRKSVNNNAVSVLVILAALSSGTLFGRTGGGGKLFGVVSNNVAVKDFSNFRVVKGVRVVRHGRAVMNQSGGGASENIEKRMIKNSTGNQTLRAKRRISDFLQKSHYE